MTIKLKHLLTTTPSVFLNQFPQRRPKSQRIKLHRLASPGRNSSPPGSSIENPETRLQIRVAWRYMASPSGGSFRNPENTHTGMRHLAAM